MRKFVSSLSNQLVREATALNRSRGRKRSGLIIFDGVRETFRAADAGVDLVNIFVCPGLMSPMERAGFLALEEPGRLSSETAVIEVTPEVMGKMAYRENPPGVVAVARRPSMEPAGFMTLAATRAASIHGTGYLPVLLVIEGAEKPGNVGAVLRTADCAGVSGVVLASSACDPYNPNLIRASLGCVFTVPLLECSSSDAFELVSGAGFRIVSALVDGAVSMWDADMTGGVAIAMGSEKDGLSEVWRKPPALGVRIPMSGAADSLNLAMATGLLVYEAFRQRNMKKSPPVAG